MAGLQQIPGYSNGFIAKRYSSMNKRVIGKFTDSNHISHFHQAAPADYDKKIISLYTQTSLFSNDFLQMLQRTKPYYINKATNEFKWKVSVPYQYPTVVSIPDTTATASNVGIDGHTFELVFDKKEFFLNDVITSHRIYGQQFIVKEDPIPDGRGYKYTLALVSLTPMTEAVDPQWLIEGREYEFLYNATGEFDQDGTGLGSMGDEIWLYDTLGSGSQINHQVTGWADIRVASGLGGGTIGMSSDAAGNSEDLIMYSKQVRNDRGETSFITAWEPFIEMEMRKRMLSMKTNKMIWAKGGTDNTAQTHEKKKLSMGVIPRMRQYGNLSQYNAGQFSINLLRNVFGDLFYRRVDVSKRRVKLFTNEAGIEVFNNANKDDLLKAGLTVIADNRFIEGSGRNMLVKWAFDSAYTTDTGLIEVSHLMELDLPQTNSEFGRNKKSTPIFMVFDVSPEGDNLMSDNIREVRMQGEPSMTWGYVDGTYHHLGHAKSQGMSSANMFPGYKVWMKDRYDVFMEDPTRTAVIEEVPQF